MNRNFFSDKMMAKEGISTRKKKREGMNREKDPGIPGGINERDNSGAETLEVNRMIRGSPVLINRAGIRQDRTVQQWSSHV